MTTKDIIQLRLINQQIAQTQCKEPAELVSFLTAMQAQEYPMAKWAIGLRLPGISESRIEEDFNSGSFLRTHLLRPTWHFVAPADIRWILSLTSPTVQAFNAYYYRRSGLDVKLFSRAMNILQKMLEGKNFLTRTGIQHLLEKNKIEAKSERLAMILMFAELEGLICSGPRMGKQFTYALLEERVENSLAFRPKDPLPELARRYFSTRGPATAQDFMWWSGLKASQVREGIEFLPPTFHKEVLNGKDYIYLPLNQKPVGRMQYSFLLPDYDEYGISYKNRDAYAPKNGVGDLHKMDSGYKHFLVINGRISGKWRRIEKKGNRIAEALCLSGLSRSQIVAAGKAVKKYNRFLNPGKIK